MTPSERIKFSEYLARQIFSVGSEATGRPITRIQFKSGEWPDHERDEGGLCESSLATVISYALLELDKKANG